MAKCSSRLSAWGHLQLLLPRFQPDYHLPNWKQDLAIAQRYLRRESRLWLFPCPLGERQIPPPVRGGSSRAIQVIEGMLGLVRSDHDRPPEKGQAPDSPLSDGEVYRWTTDEQDGTYGHEAIVPSNTFNVVDVVHINPRGFLYPPCPMVPESWGCRLPEDVLIRWLNATPGMAFANLDPKVVMAVPQIGEAVRYVEKSIPLRPGLIIPSEKLELSALQDLTRWLPSEDTERTVFKHSDASRLSSSSLPAGRAIPITVWWTMPFRAMFPRGDGHYLLLHHHQMQRCLELLSNGKREEALSLATARISALTSNAVSTRELAWFLPLLMEDEQEALLKAHDLGLRYEKKDLECLADARAHPDYESVMNQDYPVTRVLGWEGWLWIQILDLLQDASEVRRCKNCGVHIMGKEDKLFCSKMENPDCYRDRQKERARAHYGRTRRDKEKRRRQRRLANSS